jgi:hypothetical protein
MRVLLVDETDGRVVDGFPDWPTATAAVERIEMHDPASAERLYLVELHHSDGALIGATASIIVRSLT